MNEWLGAPPRGAHEDLRDLPMHRGRWRLGCVAAGGGVAAAALALSVAGAPARELAGPIAVVALIAYLGQVQHTRGVLLGLALSRRRSVGQTVAAVEGLMQRSRGHAPLRARVLAVLAHLELTHGERERGLRLFCGLHARGWTPLWLMRQPGEEAVPLVARAAATMAALLAVEGSCDEAERVIGALRAQGLVEPARTLDAILRLQRGDVRGAACVVGPPTSSRDPDGEVHRLLHDYARHRMGGSPYRAAQTPDSERSPRALWLVAQWPPLRAFVADGRA